MRTSILSLCQGFLGVLGEPGFFYIYSSVSHCAVFVTDVLTLTVTLYRNLIVILCTYRVNTQGYV